MLQCNCKGHQPGNPSDICEIKSALFPVGHPQGIWGASGWHLGAFKGVWGWSADALQMPCGSFFPEGQQLGTCRTSARHLGASKRMWQMPLKEFQTGFNEKISRCPPNFYFMSKVPGNPGAGSTIGVKVSGALDGVSNTHRSSKVWPCVRVVLPIFYIYFIIILRSY